MNKGKRFEENPKLNYKKVFTVIVIILIAVGLIASINYSLKQNTEKGIITSTDFFAVYSNNKWGVIDSNSKEVIPPTYQEMIVIPDSSKDVFLVTYDINEEDGTYKTKVLNKKNEEIYTQYDKVEAIENYDKNQNVWYEENVLKVQKNNKYGLIDSAGKQILDCKYEEIKPIIGIKNSLIVKQNERLGLVTDTGNTIISTQYTNIEALGEDYKEGYITTDENQKQGIISYLKDQILENQYDKIEKIYSKKFFVVEEDNKEKIIDQEGNTIISKGFDEIVEISEDAENVLFTFKKDEKYGIMNEKGEKIIEAKYDYLKHAKEDIYIAKEDKKYGIINTNEEEKIQFEYTNIVYNKLADLFIADDEEYNSSIIDNKYNIKLNGILSEINTEKGYLKIRIADQYKYYNFKIEEKSEEDINVNNTLFLRKQNGKYGFVDKNGKVVIDYIYDDAREQNKYGYAAVKKDGLWGAIDIKGKIAIEPKYNLEKNLVIDFIGKWHLGEDNKMNYYCDK